MAARRRAVFASRTERLLLALIGCGFAFVAAHCLIAGGSVYALFGVFFIALSGVALHLALRGRPL